MLKRKGVDCLIRIAGDGPLHQTLLQQARDLGVNDRVEFLGYGDDIPALLSESTFLVHTADNEGCPNAVMEAMADPTTVGATWEHCVEHVEADLAELLFDWLSDFVYWKDAAGVVFSRASLSLTREGGQWTLAGTLIGEPVNQTTQVLRNDVKGVTKHLYRLHQDNRRWSVRVVLDV